MLIAFSWMCYYIKRTSDECGFDIIAFGLGTRAFSQKAIAFNLKAVAFSLMSTDNAFFSIFS